MFNIFKKEQTQTTENKIPGWLESGSKDVVSRGRGMINNKKKRKNRVAYPVQNQTAAWKGFGDLARDTKTMGKDLGIEANVRSGQNFMADPSAGIAKFYNPYEQQVIDSTQADLEQQRAIDMQKLASQKMLGGSYGGSRHSVQEGLYNFGKGGYYDRLAASLGDIRRTGFTDAYNMASDAQGQRNNAASVGTSYANSMTDNRLRTLGGLAGAGAEERGIRQDYIDAPYKDLSWMTSLLNGVPHSTTSTTRASESDPLGSLAKIAAAFSGGY